MNYSLLLTRSIDFDPFKALLYPSYPDELERPLLLSLDPDALGPRRAERLRVAHDRRPVPEHARAHGAAAHGVRRPPGGEHRHRGRGADDRRAAAPPGARPGPQHRRGARSTGSSRSAATRTAAARSWSGTSGRCARPAAGCRARRMRRHRPAADHEHARRASAWTRTGSPAASPPRRLQFSRFIDGEFDRRVRRRRPATRPAGPAREARARARAGARRRSPLLAPRRAGRSGAASRRRRSRPAATRSARRTACFRGRTTTSPSPPGRPPGRQLNLLPTATPRNKNGVPIEPADYNLSDGFSPGQTIVVKVPGPRHARGVRADEAGAGHRPGAHLRPARRRSW